MHTESCKSAGGKYLTCLSISSDSFSTVRSEHTSKLTENVLPLSSLLTTGLYQSGKPNLVRLHRLTKLSTRLESVAQVSF